MFGWLNPEGRLIKCDYLDHVDTLHQHARGEFAEFLKKCEARLKETHDACQELDDREGVGHGEWHVYEMLEGTLEGEIYTRALDEGWIRIGVGYGGLHFEGRPEALKSQHARCKQLAERLTLRAVFEPQKKLKAQRD